MPPARSLDHQPDTPSAAVLITEGETAPGRLNDHLVFSIFPSDVFSIALHIFHWFWMEEL